MKNKNKNNNNVISILKNQKSLFPLTEMGNAERFASQHHDKVRYVGPWKTWFRWDGQRWERDERSALISLAKETARSIDAEVQREADADRRKLLRAHASKTESRSGLENMLVLARAELAAVPKDFDQDPWLLNVGNGTIDLRTGMLSPHRREDMITKLAPFDFDPAAKAPLWTKFLDRVMAGNEALIGYLQRIIGYAFVGVPSEHILVFSHGNGDNGKSVFHGTIAKVLGDYASKAPRGLLYEAKGGGERHPTELADLFNSRFVLVPEVKRGQRFDEALVKDLVGEDKIKARRMHQDFWEFAPTHTLFVCGNHKPVVLGTDHGIWRRIRLIPWNVTIPKEEKDRGLLAKLETEAPGILAWAIRGCLDWQAHGLGEPVEVEAATATYRDESNPLNDFFTDRCVFDSAAKVPRAPLRAAYEAWAKEVGAEPIGAKRFAESLKERGVTDGGTMRSPGHISPVNAWRGVNLV